MARKILIVDDSLLVRQMVTLTLEGAGFEVMQAEHGQEALAKLPGASLDLIVTDLNMPVMDGISFISSARQMKEARFVPILMLTTESQPEMKQKGKAAGATGWIVKPFDPPKLLAVVAKVLG
jgi:two-component system chemotaxis response regulator CheY